MKALVEQKKIARSEKSVIEIVKFAISIVINREAWEKLREEIFLLGGYVKYPSGKIGKVPDYIIILPFVDYKRVKGPASLITELEKSANKVIKMGAKKCLTKLPDNIGSIEIGWAPNLGEERLKRREADRKKEEKKKEKEEKKEE